MEIKNKGGDVLGKIQIESLRNDHVIDKVILDLRPGDGKAIYTADTTENKFTQQTNYAAITWDNGFKQLQEQCSPWQPKFPAHSEVHAIHVYYGFDNITSDEINEMVEESKVSRKNVVVRDLKPNKKLVGISITYQEYGTFKLNIFGTTKSRIQLPDNDMNNVKQLKVRGVEAFYILNNETERLVWIEESVNGKALQYEIIGKDTSKEVLMKIAESMC
ncbi:DUF4367 domain-containing protein [Paenibacillus sp. UMB7766-LJ446]|uniref:DUF4367 domain-containing protein n=1 Tax=Paenibacillus sp. UMB7766-LJ446 TaxID=3046313 RepID=UPI00254BE08F|nr:DUF4367 domain-containing protein [Paenibacillus sp. UMB7766-LJ446]MDK8189271.1 DUF4367 domain-containing protein [Paenibacillus sp. UMB7766-LJ446]